MAEIRKAYEQGREEMRKEVLEWVNNYHVGKPEWHKYYIVTRELRATLEDKNYDKNNPTDKFRGKEI